MLPSTKPFLETRDYFLKHGVYTHAAPDTRSYNDFWDEQTLRCKEGYSIGDFKITGNMYFYLNFNQIKMKDPITGRKLMGFPLFTDVDWEFFNLLNQAEIEKKGLILLKPRRTGFSWKLSSIAAHEFNFYRDSFTIISAFEDKYSTNTYNMAKEHLNFIGIHTPWYKPKSPDTSEIVVARHQKKIDGKEVWVGYNSTIKKITFKDNPFASAGASVSKFIFDEAGIFPNIKESYNISEPTWRDGEDVIGTPIILGTGGDMTSGTQAFSEMYYDPETYNLLALDNIWDDNMLGKKCGWFIPASRQRFGTYFDPETKKHHKLIDEDGNSNEEYGKKAVLQERDKKKGDPIAYRDNVTQYPLTTQEGFLISTGNIFPTLALKDQKSRLETDRKLLDGNICCDIIINPDLGLELKIFDDKFPIRKYPIKREERFGCIEIYEPPQRNSDDEIPFGRYIAGIDPYDDDDAPTSVSLGSIIIFDRLTERIVAEYTERPEKASDFFENCRRLLLYYKAKALTENNKIGIVTYFENAKSLYLLAETPVQLRNKTEWKANLNTSYGFRASKETNSYGNSLITQWLKSDALQSQVNGTKNTHQIYSMALLDELIKFNPDPKFNFDRVSALRAMFIYHDTLSKSSLIRNNDDEDIEEKTSWGNYFEKVIPSKTNGFFKEKLKSNNYNNQWVNLFT